MAWSKYFATARVGAVAGALSGLIVSGVEMVRALPRASSGVLHALAIVGTLVPVAALVGSMLGLHVELAGAARRAAKARLARIGSLALAALPLVLLLLWVPSSWVSNTWDVLKGRARVVTVLGAVAVVTGSPALVAMLPTLAERRVSKRLGDGWVLAAATACLAFACLSYWADLKVYPGDYEDFHVGLAILGVASWAGALLLCAERFVGLERAKSWLGRGSIGLVLFASLAIALAVAAELPRRAYARSPAIVLDKVVDMARSVTDVDFDGYSSLFGGTDCAAFDSGTSPDSQEIPENGRDEDCSGRDGHWPTPPPAPSSRAAQRHFNLLLLSIDTARADHFGSYGYRRPTTPVLDALAARSLLFLEAYSQATKTWDSVPSFLTGVYPSNLAREYGIPNERPLIFRLLPRSVTIAERLRQAGYATAAYTLVDVLETQGIGRGFQVFGIAQPTAPALSFLAQVREPFFLWLHYDEPHEPYERHARHDFGARPIDRYDSDIAETDEQIGTVLAALQARHLDESTVIVVTADHGEEFLEHGGTMHLQKHYRELLHVPLIVHIPGAPPARIREVVELVDIVPTLCEVLALDAPAGAFDGMSLFDYPREPELRGAYAESLVEPKGRVGKRSFFDGRYRLMQDRTHDRFELYDLSRDGRERKNLATTQVREVERLREVLSVRSLRSKRPVRP